MVKFFYVPYQFELQMSIAYLLFQLWKKKDHGEICSCDLKCGTCIAKLDWTPNRLRQLWKKFYFNFDESISKFLEQDHSFIDFDQLPDISASDFEQRFLIRN